MRLVRVPGRERLLCGPDRVDRERGDGLEGPPENLFRPVRFAGVGVEALDRAKIVVVNGAPQVSIWAAARSLASAVPIAALVLL